MYNRKFNCFVRPKYDGSHQTFPDLNLKGLASRGHQSVYPSQMDCVWMLKQNGGGICDHEVGTGKTLIMCIAAHEMKRLNLAHKPMIIGTESQCRGDCRHLSSGIPERADSLCLGEGFSTANRVRFFNNIKNNDYDCVIMSHGQFGKIPQSPELQQRILQAELDTVEEKIAKHFAENNVDVIIYAVEKSLDSYKFNLLHCKQTFISQLKSGAMGARTIDEGAMDEKSGMNFSEYMALLSGNTDLLDKAKLEKRIASLEGERKSFNKGKRDSEFKLESKTGELRNNTAFIEAMTEDWNRFLSVVQTDKGRQPP